MNEEERRHYRELERMREKAGHDEAQALYNAEQRGIALERARMLDLLKGAKSLDDIFREYGVDEISEEERRHYRELERMREKAGHDEAQALYNAEQRGMALGEQRILNLLKSGKSPEDILREYGK